MMSSAAAAVAPLWAQLLPDSDHMFDRYTRLHAVSKLDLQSAHLTP